jgi:hypothetical protein
MRIKLHVKVFNHVKELDEYKFLKKDFETPYFLAYICAAEEYMSC